MRYNVKKKEKQVAVPGDANYIVPEDRVPLKEKICYGKVDEKDVVVPQVLDDEGNVVEVSDEKIDEEFGSAFGTVENDESENNKN